MRCLIVLAGSCILAAGCNGNGNEVGKNAMDSGPVYDAVLKVELKGSKQGEGF
jgi:hypothetical protein